MSAGNSNARKLVLQTFKNLHRARIRVFDQDTLALNSARQKINNDFKKNKNVSNTEAIEELLKFAQEVEKELRLSVVQAEELEPGRYQLKMRPEVTRLDNVPFNDCQNISSKVVDKGKCPGK